MPGAETVRIAESHCPPDRSPGLIEPAPLRSASALQVPGASNRGQAPMTEDDADTYECPASIAYGGSHNQENDIEAAVKIKKVADGEDPDEHRHYSSRAPWLRAFVLGANDGLVTVASLMLGVGGGTASLHAMILAGVAGLVGGSLSMACGEYVSVSSQRDAEEADIEKEAEQQRKGPESRRHEFQELMQIYVDRGLSKPLAYQVAKQLSETDVVRAHARDELGIDVDNLSNPVQAAVASAIAFACGAAIPLLSGSFIHDSGIRTGVVAAAASVGLLLFGALGAWLGGARKTRAALRVLVGGMAAMGITYGIGYAFRE